LNLTPKSSDWQIQFDDSSPPDLTSTTLKPFDRRWLELLFERPSTELITNVATSWGLLTVGDVSLPLTINSTDYENSYVCSPYNGCISYPRTEAFLLPNAVVRLGILGLIGAFSGPLKIGKINQVVCVNNWLLSTNLYEEFELSALHDVTANLVSRFPQHAIVYRSLNYVTNAQLLCELKRLGFLLLPSRQVYLFDGTAANFSMRHNTQLDQRLLDRSPFELVEHQQLTSVDFDRITGLYRLLYIDKYSQHNPQFTSLFLSELHRRNLWTMWGLRDNCGQLVGIVGGFQRGSTWTVPLVGYDTSIDQREGLYRQLMAVVLRETRQRGLLLNLSSGAAEFKRLRGGEACLEYSAVYCNHLNWSRRQLWRVLALLLRRVAGPLLQRYQL
jgi:Acetyltransferase (GNAT) domain